MLVSLILIFLISAGGASLTYLFAKDAPLLWRVAAGNVVGSVAFGLICFLLACAFGFSAATISLSILISLAPLLIFLNQRNRANFRADWRGAKAKLTDANLKKFFRFAYYVFFLVLFYFFFDRAMIENAQGIFTGASQNLGDLPFHLGAIFSFTDGANFPPENPSYAFAKFSYPFMADLIAASFVKCGASVRAAMLAQNVSLAFSLLVVLERFALKFTGNRLAGKIAPVLLFFCGGLGFIWFLKDYWQQAQSFLDFLWNLALDYTIRDTEKGEKFRWGNSLVVLFITQRSILLGMPLTIIVLEKLWQIFATEDTENAEKNFTPPLLQDSFQPQNSFVAALLVGSLAGTLPLVHVHSLAFLFLAGACLFFFRVDKWREWLAFAVGVAVVAVPELVWAMSGSATRLAEFVGWHFGWDKRTDNFVWFWIKNLGLFTPLLIYGIYQLFFDAQTDDEKPRDAKNEQSEISNFKSQILFYIPFALCFVITNAMKLAPWEWDNIKVLIYWFVGSTPIVALVLARLWARDKIFKIAALACLFVLTFAGALDVWRTVSGQINYKIFDRDAVKIAEQIKSKTAPDALFVNAPTYNSAVVLSGRRSLMRYSGHLSSYGIDYSEREAEVKRIYAGDATADAFLKKYNVDYVIVSPEEQANVSVNEDFFRRFPVVAEAGEYRVYRVK